MFTGIIEEVGRILAIEVQGENGRLTVSAAMILDDIKLGDSVAINGVCLTVISQTGNSLTFDISTETLQRTTLGRMRQGSCVNLERALPVNGRLGGHVVQGHVDATGRFISRTEIGATVLMRFSIPDQIARYICLKGSIAVQGISLTVSALGDSWFEVAVIPHTHKVTTLNELKNGDSVNLEADILAKYLERLMQFGKEKSGGLTMDALRDMGY